MVALIGNVNLDVIVRPASRLPPPGMEWTVEGIEVRTGGAAAIAVLTLSHLGAPRCSSGASATIGPRR